MSFPFVQTLPRPPASESESLDFKRQLSANDGKVDRFEIAKDVAALANTIGGTLLIGAVAEKNRLVRYEGLTESDAKRAWQVVEECVRDRCFPGPSLAPKFHEHDTGTVLGIDVVPSVGPIAVRVKRSETQIDGGHQYESWLFFERVTSHTREFSPEQLPMLMNPDLRRKAILLRAIPQSAIVAIEITNMVDPRAYAVTSVDELANTVVLSASDGNVVAMPIDRIETVFRRSTGVWCLIAGRGGR
ncbi:MAG TPA: ATP-binding protein [Candidatus Acidoferrales bacterium]|nr:ATP-binding protein [Candidatus Acidoferrales bacterium]